MKPNPPTRLEILRRARGVSLEQLSDHIGCSASWVSWIERHCEDPERVGKPVQKALAHFFGESFESLIERVKPEQNITTNTGNENGVRA